MGKVEIDLEFKADEDTAKLKMKAKKDGKNAEGSCVMEMSENPEIKCSFKGDEELIEFLKDNKFQDAIKYNRTKTHKEERL